MQPMMPIGLAEFGQAPPEGLVAVPLALVFVAGPSTQPQTGDAMLSQANGTFSQCRTVYIDNSLNAQPFTFSFNGGASITVAGFTQGYFPVICPMSIQWFASIGGGINANVTVWLINFLMPAYSWRAQ